MASRPVSPSICCCRTDGRCGGVDRAAIGVWSGHTGRGGFLAINIANLGRALPSLALLALMLPVALSLKLGLGFWPTFFALVPLGIPPVLTNSYVAIREVDRDVVEAARGMGLREGQVLQQVELPIAAPLIIAGVRNAAVAIVATATLGALVAGGGLGRYHRRRLSPAGVPAAICRRAPGRAAVDWRGTRLWRAGTGGRLRGLEGRAANRRYSPAGTSRADWPTRSVEASLACILRRFCLSGREHAWCVTPPSTRL